MKKRSQNPGIACLVILIMGTLATACQPQVEPPAATLPAAAPTATLTAQPSPEASVTPTEAVLALSPNPYISPNRIYSITFPQNWTCEEAEFEGVACWSADEQAGISVQVIGTGYELLQEHLESLAKAEQFYSYADKSAYSDESFESEEGRVMVVSAWREEDIFQQALDAFVRSGAGVLHVRLNARQEDWERYLPLFEAVVESVQGDAAATYGMPLYAQRRAYTSPDVLFTLELPIAWMRYVDTASIIRTQVEGYNSPDMRAAVQVAVYRKNSPMEQEDRIPVTQDLMRALYGADVRVSHYKALPDGRERMEWQAERRGVNGISYNGTYGNALYLFSVVWDNTAGNMYLPVLQDVMDSFSLP